jgi:hypothetical protein
LAPCKTTNLPIVTEEQGNLLESTADALVNAVTTVGVIINFPTKGQWRSRSRLGDITTGLADLREVIRDRDIRSIAVPPLGCGLGGLD